MDLGMPKMELLVRIANVFQSFELVFNISWNSYFHFYLHSEFVI